MKLSSYMKEILFFIALKDSLAYRYIDRNVKEINLNIYFYNDACIIKQNETLFNIVKFTIFIGVTKR